MPTDVHSPSSGTQDSSTPVSLLNRLRQAADQTAWNQFAELYTPSIYAWARRCGLQAADAADLVQDVFVVLVQKLPTFAYNRQGSFRSWLKTVTLNKWREKERRRAARPHTGEQGLSDAKSPDEVGEIWEAEYRANVVRNAWTLIQGDFQPSTWRACWEHAVQSRSAKEIAAESGMTVAAVYAATSRVLRRLRQELEGLLD